MAQFHRLVPVPLVPRQPAYPSDLTNAQWALLAPLLQGKRDGGPGRPTEVDLRAVVNALLYIKQTGCAWRYLPHDFPARSTVHYYFEKWTSDGTWEAVMGALRERTREAAGRTAQPTAGIIDSQTVKSVGVGAHVGWDGGK